jgi:hypothetical protein
MDLQSIDIQTSSIKTKFYVGTIAGTQALHEKPKPFKSYA